MVNARRTMHDARRTNHDDGRSSIALGHLSDSTFIYCLKYSGGWEYHYQNMYIIGKQKFTQLFNSGRKVRGTLKMGLSVKLGVRRVLVVYYSSNLQIYILTFLKRQFSNYKGYKYVRKSSIYLIKLLRIILYLLKNTYFEV